MLRSCVVSGLTSNPSRPSSRAHVHPDSKSVSLGVDPRPELLLVFLMFSPLSSEAVEVALHPRGQCPACLPQPQPTPSRLFGLPVLNRFLSGRLSAARSVMTTGQRSTFKHYVITCSRTCPEDFRCKYSVCCESRAVSNYLMTDFSLSGRNDDDDGLEVRRYDPVVIAETHTLNEALPMINFVQCKGCSSLVLQVTVHDR